MELREWQYMNKPAGSATNNSSSSGYKKRFEKLIKYHIDHASSELESITYKDIKDDSFHLSEHYNTGSSEFNITIIVSVNKYTDEFYLSIFVDGEVVYRNKYEGYEKVLEILTGSYMYLPDEGTQDYDDLLTESLNEWQLMNPPKSGSSKTNKEKFAELVAYMQKHKDSSVIFTSVNGPNDTGFEYEEQRASADGSEYNLSVEVSLGKHDLFTIHVDKDGKRVYNIMAKGWEELLRYLRIYFHAPNMGSPEYISLTESFSSELKEWKLMSAPSTFYKDKFKKLLDYHIAHPNPAYKIVRHNIDKLSEDADKASFSYIEEFKDDKGKTKESLIGVRYYKKDKTWTVKIYIDGIQVADKQGVGFNILIADLDVRMTLPPRNSTEYQDLLESAGSMADDFKLYENLWD